ncbi:MAG: hypothetical protein LBU14_01565 [Candidatus Peribacteria bacterium]|jgi:hypothetical protein|nr:hypothetical protein [Candidatus Peribacteria bacterium]
MENKNLLEILIIIFDFVSDFVKNILNELIFCIEKPGKNRPPQKKNKLTTAENSYYLNI